VTGTSLTAARTLSVTAEWAFHGKHAGEREGYRLLSSSGGHPGGGLLSKANFDDALERFSLGTPDVLPQVAVSFLARTDQPGGNYLALAIHEFVEGRNDGTGRKIAFTRYFCAPYRDLAAEATGYLAMFHAFRGIQLPDADGPPLAVKVTAVPLRVPPAGDLSLRVAAMLLTGRCVCVVGAEQASVSDKIRLIDDVMALLPYGLRAKMSAATWVRSTVPHRFRLFFSDLPREGYGEREPDLVAHWSQPERTVIPREYPYAHDYLTWLQDKVMWPVAKLATLTDTEELGFGTKRVIQMLDGMIGITGLVQEPGYAVPQDLLHSPVMAAQGSEGHAERTLLGVNDLVTAPNQARLREHITFLENYAASNLTEGARVRIQNIVFRAQLLRPELLPMLGKLAPRFYAAVLRVAFGLPLSYESYCVFESLLGTGSPPDPPPHPAMLEAIRRAGFEDQRVAAICLSYLDERAMRSWFSSGEVHIEALIARLAGTWQREHHAKIVCDVTQQYLREMWEYVDPRVVRAALRRHAYLAPALQLRHPGEPQYQADVLRTFLSAAYGGKELRQSEIVEIMTGGDSPPTPALLACVLSLTDRDCSTLAQEAYVAGVLTQTGFSTDTRTRLRAHVRVEFLGFRQPGDAPPLPATRALEQGQQTVPLVPGLSYGPPASSPAAPSRKKIGQPWSKRHGGLIDRSADDDL
jgi:hypothetical protein